MSQIDITPDPEDIVQAEPEEYPLRCLPVSVDGPVQTRELPGIRAGYRTEQAVGGSFAVRLLTMEPRRKSAVILPVVEDIWISSSQSGAQSGASSAFRIPVGTPFPIDHMDEVWACSTGGPTDICVMSTWWSE